jgi:hypothetical protein
MAHVEAQCLPFGQVGYYEKMKNDLEIKMQTPQQWHKWRRNAYLFGQGGCKNEKQESKSNLLQYQIFDVNLKEGTPKRLSRVAYNDFRRVGRRGT